MFGNLLIEKIVQPKVHNYENYVFGAIVLVFSFVFFSFSTIAKADEITIKASGTCNGSGTCLWNLDSAGTLTISAKEGAKDVKMDDYYCHGSICNTSTLIKRPWEDYLNKIENLVIGNNISHIGNDAFQNASNLKSVTGMKDIKTIGDEGVFAYTGLTEITIPEGVNYIGSGAFAYTYKLKNVTIPDTINMIGVGKKGQFLFQGQNALTEVNCLNTSGQCENLRELLGNMIAGKTFNIVSPTSNCKAYENKGCTACENEYFLSDGMCWAAWEKKRYTPVDAAKWLKADNNVITITFKK